MLRSMRPLTILALTTLPLLASCGLIDRLRGDGDDETGGETGASVDEPADTGGEAVAEQPDTPVAKPMPTGLDRFKHWAPRHAFINSPSTVAAALSEQELLVATADDHVGLSKDGGATWEWTKASDDVRDLAGYAGGPYLQLHGEAVSLSADGTSWKRLPQLSSDSLIDLVAAEIGIVAVGKNGGFVFFAKDGSGGVGGTLPDKFKPKALTELNGAVLAWSGKKGYGTTDGSTWTQLEQLPALGDGKTFLTSAGKCSLGKVGKAKGVTCSVSGTAYGIGDEFIVENKGVVSLTRDGGETWVAATLPFKAANSIFGAAGGPYYAVGNSGAVAISKDGATWVDQKWEESANLSAGVVDGSKVVIVGAKGTIIFSKDGGTNWDYAEPPISKSFNWAGVQGGNVVVSDGRAFLSSADLSTWVEVEAVELPGKPGACDEGPDAGETCRYDADVTTPEDLPDVRSLTFNGDVGIALGDHALVAVTNDGGATWAASHGFELGRYGATSFDLNGDNVIVTDGTEIISSADAGASWVEASLLRKYKVNAVHVMDSGMWLAATKDDIIAAKINQETWLPAADEQLKADWRAFFEVNGVVYATGSKGQLRRSEDGSAWTEVLTGSSASVIDMAGEGDSVWAATGYSRKSNNFLLHSEDGGRTFTRIMQMPGATDRPGLRADASSVTWGDSISRDMGETWTRETERYFSGLVDVADGSGMEITNLVYRYGPDRLYVVTGPGEYDWVRISSAYNEGGVLECSASSGCWMLASGVLYRPLGR